MTNYEVYQGPIYREKHLESLGYRSLYISDFRRFTYMTKDRNKNITLFDKDEKMVKWKKK